MVTGVTKNSNQVSILCAGTNCNSPKKFEGVAKFEEFKKLTSIDVDENRCLQQYNHGNNSANSTEGHHEMVMQLCGSHATSFSEKIRLKTLTSLA